MNWYVVATKPNGERTASANLMRQGFEPYLPQTRVTRRHARKVDQVKRPLFPGYIFVSLNRQTARWRSINGTLGVRHILTNNGVPQAITGGFVEALMAHEDDGVIDIQGPTLVAGDVVQVLDGPFAEQIGQIMSAEQAGRVRLLLNLMGGDVVSTMPLDMLEKIG
jgi:transcriptional antiterminator RfaH